jgi:DinB family protein
MESMRWTDRTWVFGMPAGAFPGVLERIRGTAARARELVAGVPDGVLSAREGSSWSAKEHLGHLDDLHDLDAKRLDEFLSRAGTLTAADMSNERTHSANHNARPIGDILDRLGRHRQELVARMDGLSVEDVAIECMHPRLKQRIRLIDWACFVADHDDHHLARAREAIRSVS